MRVELSLDLIIVSVHMGHYHRFCPPVILIMKKMVKMFNLGFTRCGIMEKYEVRLRIYQWDYQDLTRDFRKGVREDRGVYRSIL